MKPQDDVKPDEGQSRSTGGLGGEPIYRHFGGMCWPAAGPGLSNLQWTMRYGSTEQCRFVAASVIDAYAEMIELPERKRNAIIKELRKGPGKEAPNLSGEPLPTTDKDAKR